MLNGVKGTVYTVKIGLIHEMLLQLLDRYRCTYELMTSLCQPSLAAVIGEERVSGVCMCVSE